MAAREVLGASNLPAGTVAVRWRIDGHVMLGGPVPVGVSPTWPSFPFYNGDHVLEAEAINASGDVIARAQHTLTIDNAEQYVRGGTGHSVDVQIVSVSWDALDAVLTGIVPLTLRVQRYLTQHEIDVHNAQWGITSMNGMGAVDLAIDGVYYTTTHLAVTGPSGAGSNNIATEGVSETVAAITKLAGATATGFDTSRLMNGEHRIDWVGYGRSFKNYNVETMTEGYVCGGQLLITTNNDNAPCEIRGEWRDVYLTTGVRKLRWKLIRCDGTEEWLDASDLTVVNTHAEVATWDTDTVTPVADGVTYVRASYDPGGGRAPLVAGIRVVVAAAGHPIRHFSVEDATPIRDTYEAGKSILRTSLYGLGANQVYNYPADNLGDWFAVSGISAVENGGYVHSTGTRTAWENANNTASNGIEAVCEAHGVRCVSAFDDALYTAPGDDTKYERVACAIEDWNGNVDPPYRACDTYSAGPDTDPVSRLEYAADKLNARDANGDRIYVGIEVIDEASRQWGADPLDTSGAGDSPSYVPRSDYITTFRDTVTARTDQPMGWPILAIGTKEQRRAWEVPEISDYVSQSIELLRGTSDPDLRRGLTFSGVGVLFWPNPHHLGGDLRWKVERILCQQAGLEASGTKRQAAIAWIAELTTILFILRDNFYGETLAEWDSTMPSAQINARVWQTLGEGAAAIRGYSFDGAPNRLNRATPGGLTWGQSYIAPPFRSDTIGSRKWWSMAAAFAVAQELAPELLTEMRDPPDLGGDVDTFARPHMMGVTNWLSVPITRTVDLGTIRGTGGVVLRYEIDDGGVAVTNLGLVSSDTVTVPLCGTVVYAWRASAGPSIRFNTANGIATTDGKITATVNASQGAEVSIFVDAESTPRESRIGPGAFSEIDLSNVVVAAGQSHMLRAVATNASGTTEARIVVNDRTIAEGTPSITLTFNNVPISPWRRRSGPTLSTRAGSRTLTTNTRRAALSYRVPPILTTRRIRTKLN